MKHEEADNLSLGHWKSHLRENLKLYHYGMDYLCTMAEMVIKTISSSVHYSAMPSSIDDCNWKRMSWWIWSWQVFYPSSLWRSIWTINHHTHIKTCPWALPAFCILLLCKKEKGKCKALVQNSSVYFTRLLLPYHQMFKYCLSKVFAQVIGFNPVFGTCILFGACNTEKGFKWHFNVPWSVILKRGWSLPNLIPKFCKLF